VGTAEAVIRATIQKRPAQNAESLKVLTLVKKPVQSQHPQVNESTSRC
jgi:hypothetical protein